jgi:hypothetical protein
LSEWYEIPRMFLFLQITVHNTQLYSIGLGCT